MSIAFWSILSFVIFAQMICVGIASKTARLVWEELVVVLIGFIIMLIIAIAHCFDGNLRLSARLRPWFGLAAFIIWQLWIYPMAFLLYLNMFHGERGWVWTDEYGGEILLLDERWKTLGYDPPYGGQACAHPPWINK